MRTIGINQETGDIYIARGYPKKEHHIKDITASSARRLQYVLDKYSHNNVSFLGSNIRTYSFKDFYPQPVQNHSEEVLRQIDNLLAGCHAGAMHRPDREAVIYLLLNIKSVRGLIAKELDK